MAPVPPDTPSPGDGQRGLAPVLLAVTTVSRGEEKEQRRHPADQGGRGFCNIPHKQMSGLPSAVSRRLNTGRLQTPVNLRSPARISVLRSHLQEIICRIERLPGILAGWRFLLEAVLRLGSQIGAGAPWPRWPLAGCGEPQRTQAGLMDI